MNAGVRYLLKGNHIYSNMGFVPLLDERLSGVGPFEWQMSPAEQMGLIYLLEKLRPRVAIEIGSHHGGSLEILSKFSEKVYSIDIDPTVPHRLGPRFPNAEFLIGSSSQTLPGLIEKLQRENADVSFVLIDGDHTSKGVQCDIENILKLRPITPLFIVLHDSYNPECRKGMMSARWADNPHVHVVELDFVSGIIFPRRDLWGGLGLAVLLPEKRTCELKVSGCGDRTVQALLPIHRWSLMKDRVRLSLTYRRDKLMSALGLKQAASV